MHFELNYRYSITVETARKEATDYKMQYQRPIPLKVLNDRLSNFMHAYTLYSAVRPFGVSCILASCDPHSGPEMYMIEPSGSSYVSLSPRKSNQLQRQKTNNKFLIHFSGLLWLCHWQSKTISKN